MAAASNIAASAGTKPGLVLEPVILSLRGIYSFDVQSSCNANRLSTIDSGHGIGIKDYSRCTDIANKLIGPRDELKKSFAS
jgi:hypothetical protein